MSRNWLRKYLSRDPGQSKQVTAAEVQPGMDLLVHPPDEEIVNVESRFFTVATASDANHYEPGVPWRVFTFEGQGVQLSMRADEPCRVRCEDFEY